MGREKGGQDTSFSSLGTELQGIIHLLVITEYTVREQGLLHSSRSAQWPAGRRQGHMTRHMMPFDTRQGLSAPASPIPGPRPPSGTYVCIFHSSGVYSIRYLNTIEGSLRNMGTAVIPRDTEAGRAVGRPGAPEVAPPGHMTRQVSGPDKPTLGRSWLTLGEGRRQCPRGPDLKGEERWEPSGAQNIHPT